MNSPEQDDEIRWENERARADVGMLIKRGVIALLQDTSNLAWARLEAPKTLLIKNGPIERVPEAEIGHRTIMRDDSVDRLRLLVGERFFPTEDQDGMDEAIKQVEEGLGRMVEIIERNKQLRPAVIQLPKLEAEAKLKRELEQRNQSRRIPVTISGVAEQY